MTNENISGFLNSIAEAKRAFDAEPEYHRQIADLERDRQRLSETVASRELRIHQLKQDQETLTAKLRSAEVERDDAGFRALEEADRVSNLLTLVRGFVSDGLKAISAVEGQEQIIVSRAMIEAKEAEVQEWKVKALDDAVTLQQLRDDMRLAQEQLTRPFAGASSFSNAEGMAPLYEPGVWGERAVDPTTAPTPSSVEPQEATNASSVGSGLTESQSVTDPTATSSSGPIEASSIGHLGMDGNPVTGQSDGPFASTQSTMSETVSTGNATESADVSTSASPPERNRDESTRFKGRKYYDVSYYVPLHEWLLKGGTREDYDWRPLPEANRASNFS